MKNNTLPPPKWNGKRVETVYSALDNTYGPLPRRSMESPVDVLIRTILSQNTTDINSNKAYNALRRKFPKWTNVLKANPHNLATTIRCGGLANIKAEYIQKTLRMIHEREGQITLNHLKTLRTEDALNQLTCLPGVGIKTACCVLLFGFNRPVMPVDTHVYRVAVRLGWVKRGVPINCVHTILEQMILKRWILPIHLYVIQLGRTICRPRKPDCRHCPIYQHCFYFQRVSIQEKVTECRSIGV